MSSRITKKESFAVLLAAMAVVFTLFEGIALSGEFVARGSDSTIGAVQALADAFHKKSGTAVKVEGGGSSKGAKDCLAGQVPLAFMSRGPKDSEKSAGLVAVAYAIDGVAVIVHKSNPVDNLTLEQLKAIYTGQMKTWPEGKPILAFNRPTTSGTREVFKEVVLGGKTEFDPGIQIKHDKAAVMTVAKAATAMAFTSADEVTGNTEVKIVKVNGIAPTPSTLRDKSYPIARTLHFGTKGNAQGDVKAFLDFAVSDEGQKVLEKAGFVPLRELK
ncbi:MAG: phosphate ABC transporter substrate-binding protein [Deltaproteobacteria bacterium]|nr:phosphate ABC transporter substrate-binding protein [Deltaproteobacteria bacterium]